MCDKFDDDVILVGMNDAMITGTDKPIIGTFALATCVGVLLYDKESKIAIVGHVSSDVKLALDKIFTIIIKNKLLNVKFKYKIIMGYDKEPALYYKVIDILENHFKDYEPLEEINNENIVHVDEETKSCEFAFDVRSGTFVTDRVFCNTYNNVKRK